MASQAIWKRVLVLLVAVSASYSLTLDEEGTNDVIAAASASEDGQIAILVRGPSNVDTGREELLHAKGTDDNSISLFYNKKSNKVSLESLNGGHIKSVSWSLDSNHRGNVLLVITHSKVKILTSCKSLNWHTMSGRHDVLKLLASQKLKLYHEENAPVEVYGNEKSALDSLSCNHEDALKPPSSMTVDSDVEEVKDFIEKEERFKQEEEMQGDDPRNNYIDPNIYGPLPQPTTPGRGDIPATDIESCDDEVIRQLKFLRQTIELLRRELDNQKGNIDNLRNELRICCNRVPSTPPVERCSGSSCYPGY